MKQALTTAEILRWAEGYLIQRKVPSPYLDAEYILAHILRCQRMDLLIHPDRTLKDDEIEQFKASRDVLIPRPETELLVDEVIKSVRIKGATVLDLCTGSGCIAVCIARELNDSKVYAVDISG